MRATRAGEEAPSTTAKIELDFDIAVPLVDVVSAAAAAVAAVAKVTDETDDARVELPARLVDEAASGDVARGECKRGDVTVDGS